MLLQSPSALSSSGSAPPDLVPSAVSLKVPSTLPASGSIEDKGMGRAEHPGGAVQLADREEPSGRKDFPTALLITTCTFNGHGNDYSSKPSILKTANYPGSVQALVLLYARIRVLLATKLSRVYLQHRIPLAAWRLSG